jgi:hypothetical protein
MLAPVIRLKEPILRMDGTSFSRMADLYPYRGVPFYLEKLCSSPLNARSQLCREGMSEALRVAAALKVLRHVV